jgi:hypothetical protein
MKGCPGKPEVNILPIKELPYEKTAYDSCLPAVCPAGCGYGSATGLKNDA